MENLRDTGVVILQPYRGRWCGSAVRYVPLYQGRYGHTDEVGEPAKEAIPYSQIIFSAELKANGELSHGTEAKLRKSGTWGLFLDES